MKRNISCLMMVLLVACSYLSRSGDYYRRERDNLFRMSVSAAQNMLMRQQPKEQPRVVARDEYFLQPQRERGFGYVAAAGTGIDCPVAGEGVSILTWNVLSPTAPDAEWYSGFFNYCYPDNENKWKSGMMSYVQKHQSNADNSIQYYKFYSSTKVLKSIADTIREKDADVLCLQEVNPASVELLSNALKDSYKLVCVNHKQTVGRNGVCIFCKNEIEIDESGLNQGKESFIKDIGGHFVAVLLKKGNKDFIVGSVHLGRHPHHMGSKGDENQWVKKVQGLWAFIRGNLPGINNKGIHSYSTKNINTPIVLAGDFNTYTYSMERSQENPVDFLNNARSMYPFMMFKHNYATVQECLWQYKIKDESRESSSGQFAQIDHVLFAGLREECIKGDDRFILPDHTGVHQELMSQDEGSVVPLFGSDHIPLLAKFSFL